MRIFENSNRFLELHIKVNKNNAISVEYVVFKFIQGLKFQIMLLMYTKNLIILNNIITIIRYIKRELNLVNESKQVYTLEN